ncbi:hypothetical protein PCIT_a1082 [Pseudoalteromonas citrea]|uniref:Anti-bacteriophage protein A/HamA C-terminal domain-containing protein n=2 Tax=Pseudoalteromonas citrea TaxID=43655 RepID=A0AAD4FTM3_9GAMM|nr:Hachiman antiphage defense system protein HamA [Pseudoalteromonas citrea]KAF7775004.1 hypothetical protein PCIT_a1082 [Pseudoalteromonas citrea]
MSLDTSNKLTVRILNDTSKYGTGVICKLDDCAYVFTAKHTICPKDKDDCFRKGRECNNCELKNSYSAKKTKITIDKPEAHGIQFKPKTILHLKNKDLAILVLKENDFKHIQNLPKITLAEYAELPEKDTYLAHGYCKIEGSQKSIPLIFDYCTVKDSELFLRLASNTTSNLEISTRNIEGASGAGVFLGNPTKLAGIYVKTEEFQNTYSEFFDETVNMLLQEHGLPKVIIEHQFNRIKSLTSREYLNCFEEIVHSFDLGSSRKLDLLTIKLNGKKIDYPALKERLLECLHILCIPRKTIKSLNDRDLTRKLYRDGEKEYSTLSDEDKLSDLLLQGLLESREKMPKLYSSFNVDDVSTNVHLNYIDASKSEFVYCYSNLTRELNIGFENVIEKLCRGATNVSGPADLISSGILESHFSEDEQKNLIKILLPSETSNGPSISDSYALLVGFEFDSSTLDKLQSVEKFRQSLHDEIKTVVANNLGKLKEYLLKIKSMDSEVKVFFIPFENISEFKKSVDEELYV